LKIFAFLCSLNPERIFFSNLKNVRHFFNTFSQKYSIFIRVADKILSEFHFAVHAVELPPRAHMLAIRGGSGYAARNFEGILAWRTPPVKMSSVGHERVRPCSAAGCESVSF
jgi:hypothetical protein